MSMSDVIREAHKYIVIINVPYATFAISHIFVKLNLLFNQLSENVTAYYIAKKYQIVTLSYTRYSTIFRSNIN